MSRLVTVALLVFGRCHSVPQHVDETRLGPESPAGVEANSGKAAGSSGSMIRTESSHSRRVNKHSGGGGGGGTMFEVKPSGELKYHATSSGSGPHVFSAAGATGKSAATEDDVNQSAGAHAADAADAVVSIVGGEAGNDEVGKTDDTTLHEATAHDVSGADSQVVASKATSFASLEVRQASSGHKTFYLNNATQSSTEDEYKYNELLVQPALAYLEQNSSVLIIGGGEGAALREVLTNAKVSEVTMVELDGDLVQFAKEYLPEMHQGSFESPKVAIVIGEGVRYMHDQDRVFDAIIVDGTDAMDTAPDMHSMPHADFAGGLFERPFYDDAYNALRPGGAFVQYASDFSPWPFMKGAGFVALAGYEVPIDSLDGGGAVFAYGRKPDSKAAAEQAEVADSSVELPDAIRRMQATQLFRYLSPESMQEALSLWNSTLDRGEGAGPSGGRGRRKSQRSRSGGPVERLALLQSAPQGGASPMDRPVGELLQGGGRASAEDKAEEGGAQIPGMANVGDIAFRAMDMMLGTTGIIPTDYPFACICNEYGTCDRDVQNTPCPHRVGQMAAARRPAGGGAAAALLAAAVLTVHICC